MYRRNAYAKVNANNINNTGSFSIQNSITGIIIGITIPGIIHGRISSSNRFSGLYSQPGVTTSA